MHSMSSDSSRWSKYYESDTSEEPVYRRALKAETPSTNSIAFSTESSLDSVQYELDESEEFYTGLAEAVRLHPCLYDPMDKCYRTNEKYRNDCWAQVATRINYRGDTVPLSKQWLALRETYREWRHIQLNYPDDLGQFPILFASLSWLDRFVIPLIERLPIFATMVTIHNHVAKQKELAEKRAESWKVAAKSKTKTIQPPPVVRQKDVYDISTERMDTDEEDKGKEDRTPKARTTKKIQQVSVKSSTPRRLRRSYQPVVEDDSTG